MDYIVTIIGLTAVMQGMPYLLSPKVARNKIKRWLKHDDMTFRTFGAVAFGIGLGIIYLGVV